MTSECNIERTQMNQRSDRIISIDVLRGITILVMIFVNDVAGVTGVPAWMKHISPPLADGMTFVDWVFPSFLFIVGMSLPFAISIRLEKGDSLWMVIKHILIRTVGLLIIGVFMVNTEHISNDGLLNPLIWSLLMYIGVILVWRQPKTHSQNHLSLDKILKAAGILILIVLAIIFRSEGEQGLIEIRPHWWGILGLIGWAYLVSAVMFLIFRKNLTALLGMVAILYCIYFADKVGSFEFIYDVFPWINIGGMLGSHAAITLSGVILGIILMPDSAVKTSNQRIRWALLYGLGLFIAGYLIHTLNSLDQMFIINKILATPAWCLICSAYTVWIWVIIYYLIDVKGWNKWIKIVKPAGANALFAYILAPILYYIFALTVYLFNDFNFYHWLGQNFAIGFWRAVIFSFLVTWLAGGLRRLGLVLKL
jgi:heparan-alpha-glucosaminide N-acetyltransferase